MKAFFSRLLILALTSILICCATPFSKIKARNIAQEYLLEKYEQEMKHIHTRFSWIDPALYHVYFSPINEDGIIFEVIIQPDFSLSARQTKYGNYIPDNYFLMYFKYFTVNYFQQNIQQIWADTEVRVYTSFNNQGIYGFNVPLELNENMEALDMDKYLDYNIGISTDCLLNDTTKEAESVKILKAIEIIRESPYNPKELTFSYYRFSKQPERYFITIKNWNEINSHIEVLEIINNNYYYKQVHSIE